MNTNCVKCGCPNEGDILSMDGLCFGCDVEETLDGLNPEHVASYLDSLSEALPAGYIRTRHNPRGGNLGGN